MGVLEILGISPSKDKPQRRFSGLNIGIIIMAVGCVSMISRAWVISTLVIAVGLLVFIISAALHRSKKPPEST